MSEENMENKTPETVPYERFKKINDELKEARSKLEEFSSKAKDEENWKTKFEHTSAAFEQYKAEHLEERELNKINFTDPDGIDVARVLHKKYSDGKVSLPEWLSSIKEDPESIPSALKNYLITEAEEAENDEPVKPRTKKPMPNSRNSVQKSSQTQGTLKYYKGMPKEEFDKLKAQERALKK